MRVAAGHYLNIVAGDFVEQTDLFNVAISFDEDPLPPGEPELASFAKGHGYVTVGFLPPQSYGTDPITSYTLTLTDNTNPAGTRAASGASSPITVQGLTSGDVYQFTLTATSAAGTGAPLGPSGGFRVP